MPELKKRIIVIASVLKPVNDVRMAEKLGLSLLKEGKFEVHVIGFPISGKPLSGLITHALPYFKRLSLTRIFIRIRIARKTIALRPDLFIVTTHELLGISILVRILSGAKVIYDIQENYYRNILYTQTFPSVFRPLLAGVVRIKECVTSIFVNHFFLAERAYEHEFSFHRGKFTLLENKAKRPVGITRESNEMTKLLFSGTLAETTGVFEAIEIAVKLHALDENISLTLIGYCARTQELEKIRNTIEAYPFIALIGGNHLVSHEQIIEMIQSSHLGIISYPPNRSTENSIPTKLYEYLACQLPILLIRHPVWEEICRPYSAAVAFDASAFHTRDVLHALRTERFYTKIPQDVYWESEEGKLLGVVSALIGE